MFKKCYKCEDKELLRKQWGNENGNAGAAVEQTLHSPEQPLDNDTRSFMENLFGFDFSKVAITNNSLAHKSPKDINAYILSFGAVNR